MPSTSSVVRRIFIVDDDPSIRSLMTTLPGRHEIVVDCVEDGDPALRKRRQQQYDSIVLDLMLPNANGFEVIRNMKRHLPNLLERTIVVTAASEHALRDFTDGRLVRRLIRKPFDFNDFVAEILSCSEPWPVA